MRPATRAESRALEAAHEAGHATVAHALGLAVRYASIQRLGMDAHAIVAVGSPLVRATVALAGGCAEEIFLAERGLSGSPGGCSADHELATHVLGEAYSPAERAEALGLSRSRARSILFARWSTVGRLAVALLDHRDIGGAELAELLNRTGPLHFSLADWISARWRTEPAEMEDS